MGGSCSSDYMVGRGSEESDGTAMSAASTTATGGSVWQFLVLLFGLRILDFGLKNF